MSVPAFEDRRGRWTTCAQPASDVSARWHLESVCVCSSQYKTSFFLLNRHGRPVPTVVGTTTLGHVLQAPHRNMRSHITYSTTLTHMQGSRRAMRHIATCDHTSFIAQHPHTYWIVCYRVWRRIGLFGDIPVRVGECCRRSTQ